MKKVLVTGAAGFIGSNFVKLLSSQKENLGDYKFVLLDLLTYAGNKDNIKEDLEAWDVLSFVQMDIRDSKGIEELFQKEQFDGVINFAAESHVDRSIEGPQVFLETNIMGTFNLLEETKKLQKGGRKVRFLQVSTDEVYGSLGPNDPSFTETTPIDPRSPYSSSKASADHLVNSYNETFGLDTVITRCGNNYGAFQFPEKLIPVVIDKILKSENIPVYGNGANIRNWIHVKDHANGVWQAYLKGSSGHVYNFGSEIEVDNLNLVKKIIQIMDSSEDLISFVTDRLGHDFRYSMNSSKAKKELGWNCEVSFEDGLKDTIDWYLENKPWIADSLKRAGK